MNALTFEKSFINSLGFLYNYYSTTTKLIMKLIQIIITCH